LFRVKNMAQGQTFHPLRNRSLMNDRKVVRITVIDCIVEHILFVTIKMQNNPNGSRGRFTMR
jgi:hypothetical protein